jgi:hypothetical protein
MIYRYNTARITAQKLPSQHASNCISRVHP